jgi:integrase
MAKAAKPFKEGAGWAMRRRVMGQDIYVSGHRTSSQAQEEMARRVDELKKRGSPKGMGPTRTTVGQALQDYGLERLPFMKGAEQEARRINRYLRAAGLATLETIELPLAREEQDTPKGRKKSSDKARHYYDVVLKAPEVERKIPKGLGKHRGQQAKETSVADMLRDNIACMAVAEVQRHHVQELMDAMRKVRGPATVGLERALLRAFFNHASDVWNWSEPAGNPAIKLKMPKVDNTRDRVMSTDEQERLEEAVKDCRNALVGPTLVLLRETAMRSGEPLKYALWKDVDWEAHLIRLPDSKNDKREVPLSPAAEEALRQLAELNTPEPDERVVQMTYSALAKAWTRACERAGITDLHLHDLRHTAATRLALETGNVFLVRALTGHKTLSQLERYVNVKASDVVALMHGRSSEPTHAAPAAELPREEPVDVVGNVIRADFRNRRVA